MKLLAFGIGGLIVLVGLFVSVIELLDHIFFNRTDYYSFLESGQR